MFISNYIYVLSIYMYILNEIMKTICPLSYHALWHTR